MRSCCWLLWGVFAVSCAHRPAKPAKAPADAAAAVRPAVAGGTPSPRVVASSSAPITSSATAAPPPPRPPSGYRIGVVRAIGTGSRFVLLETLDSSNPAIPDGQELRCFRPATDAGSLTAVVRISRERRPPFLVADVVTGQPQAGDEVYLIKGSMAASPTASPSATSFLFPPAALPAAGYSTPAPRSTP